MAKNLIIEPTMAYGDLRALPLDFLRDQKKQTITYNFDCLEIMTAKNRDERQRGKYDQTKVPYDSIKFDYSPRNLSFLQYSLKKICYELKKGKEENKDKGEVKEKKGIQNLKFIYLNIDGNEETLLDTSEGKKGIDFQTIEFQDGEIIEAAVVYQNEDGFCGLDITTNKKKNYMIGERTDDNIIIFEEQKNKDKVIVGFGCWANEQYGVSSIYFYLIKKTTFAICQTYGMRQLRAKITADKDKEFIDGLPTLKEGLNDEQKLLCDVCKLPPPVYFNVLKYVMPY